MPTVKINGMSCQHCVSSVRKALENVTGVKNVQVNLEKGEATYDGEAAKEQVNSAITAVGFEVTE